MPIVIVQIKIEFSSLNFLRKWILGILFLILPKKHNYGDNRWIMVVNHGRSLNSATSIPTRKFSIKLFLKALFSVTDIKSILSFWCQVWILIWCYSKYLYLALTMIWCDLSVYKVCAFDFSNDNIIIFCNFNLLIWVLRWFISSPLLMVKI